VVNVQPMKLTAKGVSTLNPEITPKSKIIRPKGESTTIRPEVELAKTKAEFKAKQQLQNEFDTEIKKRVENIRGTRDEILELTETLDRKLKNGEITHDQAIELVKKYDDKYAKMAENPVYKSKYDQFNAKIYDTIAKYEPEAKIEAPVDKSKILTAKKPSIDIKKTLESLNKKEWWRTAENPVGKNER